MTTSELSILYGLASVGAKRDLTLKKINNRLSGVAIRKVRGFSRDYAYTVVDKATNQTLRTLSDARDVVRFASECDALPIDRAA